MTSLTTSLLPATSCWWIFSVARNNDVVCLVKEEVVVWCPSQLRGVARGAGGGGGDNGWLEVGLSVQGGGEGHVVERSLDGVHPAVGLHPLYAVLRLVGGQLASQLLGQNVGLEKQVDM